MNRLYIFNKTIFIIFLRLIIFLIITNTAFGQVRIQESGVSSTDLIKFIEDLRNLYLVSGTVELGGVKYNKSPLDVVFNSFIVTYDKNEKLTIEISANDALELSGSNVNVKVYQQGNGSLSNVIIKNDSSVADLIAKLKTDDTTKNDYENLDFKLLDENGNEYNGILYNNLRLFVSENLISTNIKTAGSTGGFSVSITSSKTISDLVNRIKTDASTKDKYENLPFHLSETDGGAEYTGPLSDGLTLFIVVKNIDITIKTPDGGGDLAISIAADKTVDDLISKIKTDDATKSKYANLSFYVSETDRGGQYSGPLSDGLILFIVDNIIDVKIKTQDGNVDLTVSIAADKTVNDLINRIKTDDKTKKDYENLPFHLSETAGGAEYSGPLSNDLTVFIVVKIIDITIKTPDGNDDLTVSIAADKTVDDLINRIKTDDKTKKDYENLPFHLSKNDGGTQYSGLLSEGLTLFIVDNSVDSSVGSTDPSTAERISKIHRSCNTDYFSGVILGTKDECKTSPTDTKEIVNNHLLFDYAPGSTCVMIPNPINADNVNIVYNPNNKTTTFFGIDFPENCLVNGKISDSDVLKGFADAVIAFMKLLDPNLSPATETKIRNNLVFSAGSVVVSATDDALDLVATAAIDEEELAKIANAVRTNTLSLLGSVRSYLDYGSCVIEWSDSLTSTGTISGGGNFNLVSDLRRQTIQSSANMNIAKNRFCVSVDGLLIRRKNENLETGNEIMQREQKGTASLKLGLLHRNSANNQSRIMSDYTLYTFIAYAIGDSKTEDATAIPNIIEATAKTGAAGLGFQAAGRLCQRYDFSVGGHKGHATGNGSGVQVKARASGVTASGYVNCPLPKSKFYFDARARYNSGEESSTNYGVGVGYEISENISVKVDYDRTKIEEVENKVLSFNVIAQVWDIK